MLVTCLARDHVTSVNRDVDENIYAEDAMCRPSDLLKPPLVAVYP